MNKGVNQWWWWVSKAYLSPHHLHGTGSPGVLVLSWMYTCGWPALIYVPPFKIK
jgi:hypothetical protein